MNHKMMSCDNIFKWKVEDKCCSTFNLASDVATDQHYCMFYNNKLCDILQTGLLILKSYGLRTHAQNVAELNVQQNHIDLVGNQQIRTVLQPMSDHRHRHCLHEMILRWDAPCHCWSLQNVPGSQTPVLLHVTVEGLGSVTQHTFSYHARFDSLHKSAMVKVFSINMDNVLYVGQPYTSLHFSVWTC